MVLRFAPIAAERAAGLGAHREAAAQIARALRVAGELAIGGAGRAARGPRVRVLSVRPARRGDRGPGGGGGRRRALGDTRKEGDALRALGRTARLRRATNEAGEACREAVAMLEQLEPGRELAMAYATLAQRYVIGRTRRGRDRLGDSRAELARRLDDTGISPTRSRPSAVRSSAATGPTGSETLAQSLELARRAGLEDVGRSSVFVNLAWLSLGQRRPRTRRTAPRLRIGVLQREVLTTGASPCSPVALGWSSTVAKWIEAGESATEVLRSRESAPVPASSPARSGADSSASRRSRRLAAADVALTEAEPTGEPQQIAPVAAARAEAAWLEGRSRESIEATDATLRFAPARSAAMGVRPGCRLAPPCRRRGGDRRRGRRAVRGRARRRSRAGGRALDRARLVATRRRWRSPARTTTVRFARSLVELQAPRRRTRRRDRRPARFARAECAGCREDRGRRSGRTRPGSTTREVEVLKLVAAGLRNAEIGERLFVSEKTVGHHVSASCTSSTCARAAEAGAAAVRLGIAAQDRE